MAILEAVEILLSLGARPRPTILLAFGHDEEIGGVAGAARIAEHLKSHGIRVKYALDEGSVITRGIIPGLRFARGLDRHRRKRVRQHRAGGESPGGHSSMPPPQTAAGIIAAAVTALETHPMPAAVDGPMAGLVDRLAPEMPFWSRLAIMNQWLLGGLMVRELEKSPATNAGPSHNHGGHDP